MTQASCAKEQGLRGGLLDALLRALAVVRVELRLVVCIAGVLPVLPLLLANGRVGDQADGHGPGVRANLELQPLVCLPAIFQLVRGIKTVARIPAKQRSARLSPCSIAARLSAAADCLFLTHLLVCWGSQPDLSEVPQQEHSSSSMPRLLIWAWQSTANAPEAEAKAAHWLPRTPTQVAGRDVCTITGGFCLDVYSDLCFLLHHDSANITIF